MKAFPAETTEAFCDGHNAAFRCFGGVPRRIVYDNTTLAVARGVVGEVGVKMGGGEQSPETTRCRQRKNLGLREVVGV